MGSVPAPDDYTTIQLDLVGLKCPLPVLRTRKALASMAAGALLEVCASDPLAAIDIPHLLHQLGDTLVAQQRKGSTLLFTIRKGSVSG